MKNLKSLFGVSLFVAMTTSVSAQSLTWICSTEDNVWQKSKIKLLSKLEHTPVLRVDETDTGTLFKNWGTTFNELCWDALSVLTRTEQDEVLYNIFSPHGDLRITRGRIPMGANDYARSWYSCDEVEGDFELRYFNIERDKQAIIPFIRAAQKYNPTLTFWISPWCPPSWMKINGDYPVLSSPFNNLSEKQNYLLYGTAGGQVDENEMKLTGARDGVFPRQLATTDFMIQDPRYLQAYADYFCKFIESYKEQGIPVDMVMYQNEAYSYTPYPGCAWTAAGTIRFNKEYLAPALEKKHPGVKLYLGTFNTNRRDHVETILADTALCRRICGMGFQWEGREILPSIREQHPDWEYVCSESECGWGSFDWKAGEHTFELINHYLGNGCCEYNLWNCILTDHGESTWGWKQNALVRVDSQKRTFTYTPEYYAVKHYSHVVAPGSKMLRYKGKEEDNKPVIVFLTPENKYLVIAGNFNDGPQELCVQLGNKYLDVILQPHSLNTFCMR